MADQEELIRKNIIEFLQMENNYYQIDKVLVDIDLSLRDYIAATACFGYNQFTIRRVAKQSRTIYIINYDVQDNNYIILSYQGQLTPKAIRYIGFVGFFLAANIELAQALANHDKICQVIAQYASE